jgi:UDP-N-acetylglucosamine--N-acetylmuramyl-(pentapeptide) pyrophosphoryl-undecaprenol N-acetylglucosamine transferase
MTNRILKWFSQQIFVSFEETKKYFPERKTFVTGNPIRKEILKGRERKKGDRFTLLIFGGSTGAHRINQAMIEGLNHLQEIRSSLTVIHQTGKEDLDFVSKGYQEKGFDALVRPFFDDMGTYYQISDLIICRSGASTVAELAICGKAALLIPYPYAAHRHQWINAKKLVDLGAARMMLDEEVNGQSLAQIILHLYGHPEERAKMEETIQQLARPRAAEEIVDHCYALIGKKSIVY